MRRIWRGFTALTLAAAMTIGGFPAFSSTSYAASANPEVATSGDAAAETAEDVTESVADVSEVVSDAESADDVLEEEENPVLDAVSETITLTVHQQTYGTLAAVSSGEVAGNTGTGKRLEGFTIARTTQGEKLSGNIEYQAHCQSVGWQDWKTEGNFAGTSGLSKRLEAVRIRLTGDLADAYDVYYRVYMSNSGWLGWTKNGEIAGTVGYAASLEGMQVALLKKGDTSIRTESYASITAENLNDVIYSGHLQTYGDVAACKNGATLGTTGQGKRLEAISIRLSHGSNQIYGTVNYKVHCQTYGWMDQVTEGKTAGTTGEAKRMEAISISLSGDIAKYCNIYYRVHCQKHGWLGWARNGENAGTSGNGYRMEAIEIKILPKGSPAPGSRDNAYTTKVVVSNTSGYAMLEPYLDQILAQCTNSSMTKEEKLWACYVWVRDHYVYRSIGADYPSNFKWHEYYAYQLVTLGYGNCYRFNSLFGHLALRIGYTDVVFYKGYSSGEPHGWVTIDGKLYDPRYAHKYGGNFFGSTGGRVYTAYESSR